ncbi:MAG TPA: ABC transporter permease [Bosea sp. (in: a-proteobacteria)]|jgi:NitT/TauT family transport system permease protein|uniref:ABC transporter permease n=1 Tax=Bosea sp. (in: a-proteobacteria) TaxID=1871050 RepID=UPI002E14FFC6|nr:ABC transporter permease [Bosea sp. (in: a-proteobacteria)]
MAGSTDTRVAPVPAAPRRPALRVLLDDQRVIGWGFLIALLAVWEFVVIQAQISPLYLPRPTRVVAVLWQGVTEGGLATDLGLTLYRIFAGFFIALVTGVLLGVWMAVSKPVKAMADILIAALYPLPKVTLIPLLVIWLGTGGPFMLTISFMGAFFPIVINTVVGVQQCEQGLVLAARDLGANLRQIVLRVLIPSAVPSIFAGIRIGLGISIILVVAAEMVVAKDGLGARLFVAGQLLDTELVFAVLLVLAVLGILITKGQDLIDARLGLWRTN